jgi:hypothetical protein
MIIMSLFAIYNALVARSNSGFELFVIKAINAILYCFNTVSIIYFVCFPFSCNICVPLTSAPLLWLFYLASIGLQLLSHTLKGKYALINVAISLATDVISLILLGSTIYILAALKVKMTKVNQAAEQKPQRSGAGPSTSKSVAMTQTSRSEV